MCDAPDSETRRLDVSRSISAALRSAPQPLRIAFALLVAVTLVQLTLDLDSYLTFSWPTYLAKNVHTVVRGGQSFYVSAGIATTIRIVVWVVTVLSEGLVLVMALLLIYGRRWPRVLLSIFALFAVAGILDFPVTPIAAIADLASVTAVVLLWLPSSSRFFRNMRASRVFSGRTRFHAN